MLRDAPLAAGGMNLLSFPLLEMVPSSWGKSEPVRLHTSHRPSNITDSDPDSGADPDQGLKKTPGSGVAPPPFFSHGERRER